MEKLSFSQMEISEEIKRAVAEMGFEEATAIQTLSIPLIMQGRDVIGRSQTGSGKTAAFGIPAIEMISPEFGRQTQVLILCPTRELAVQACDEIRKFAKYRHGVKAVPIYGGQPIERQITQLKQGAQIVIGTPGRVMDHIRRRTLKLASLKMVILDEADEMLNMGFREDIETILKEVPEERQTVLFSATMPPEILKITNEYQKNPEMVHVKHKELTVPTISQFCCDVPTGHKPDVLCRLIDIYNPKLSIIFCNTKKMVDELVSELQARGYEAEGLHGDMKQSARTQVMDKFKAHRTEILVATDVAARGIDVDDIDAVFNFDIPQDEEYYVHRIGRTGRAGKEGMAFTLVCGRRQMYELKDIQRYTKAEIKLIPAPSFNEVKESRLTRLADEIRQEMKKESGREYMQVIDSLTAEDYTVTDIAAALIAMRIRESGGLEDSGLDAVIKAKASKLPKGESKPMKANIRSSKAPSKGMAMLMINIGSLCGIRPNNVVGAIAGESGIKGSDIGSIKISDKYTLVEVPAEQKEQVIAAMHNCRINGKPTTTVEVSGEVKGEKSRDEKNHRQPRSDKRRGSGDRSRKRKS